MHTAADRNAGGPYLLGVGNTLLLDGSTAETDYNDAIVSYAGT